MVVLRCPSAVTCTVRPSGSVKNEVTRLSGSVTVLRSFRLYPKFVVLLFGPERVLRI